MLNKSKKPFYYIDGVSPNPARRFAHFYFEDLFVSLKKNNNDRTYDITLIKPTDEDELDDVEQDIIYWKDYWGANYRFFWKED